MTDGAGTLAVANHAMGLVSETFVARHARDLLPGRTVTVSRDDNDERHWRADAPHLVLYSDAVRASLPLRIMQRLGRRAGYRIDGAEKRMTTFLRRNGVEVVLAEYLHVACDLFSLLEGKGFRFFAHAHGFDVSRLLREKSWIERYQALRRADGVITMSRVSKCRLLDLGFAEDRVHVVPYGVDIPEEPVRLERPKEKVRCLAVGRMTGKKAPFLLLESFRRALQHHPDLHLDYVGDGPLYAIAEQFVGTMDLTDRVTLHGAQPNDVVLRLMREADLFVQHSITDPQTGDAEGLPVAILEAMAHGLPVVSTRHEGIPEAVVHGETGLLVDEQDVEGMAAAIAELAAGPSRRRAMSKRGRARCEAQFSWEVERRSLLHIMGLE